MMNREEQERLKKIYYRYHRGQALIMDDLRYLWQKDPEGYKKFSQGMVESKVGFELQKEIPTMKVEIPQNIIERKWDSNRKDNMLETMIAIRVKMGIMEDSERRGFLNYVDSKLVQEQVVKKMKYWDDSVIEKVAMYTYDQEKEFSILT